jgi:hypothetical protein
MFSNLRNARLALRIAVAAVATAASLTAIDVSAQTYLIDTGPGGTSSIGATALFGSDSSLCVPPNCDVRDFQYLAARITLPQAATVTGIDLWVVRFSSGGSMTVKIREEVAGLPAASAPPLFSANSIYAKTYTGVPNVFGDPTWVSFGGYEAVLAAGTYWITFEPVAGSDLNYSVPGGVPNPLTNYAFYSFGNPGYRPLNRTFGVRVAGSYFNGVAFGTAARLSASGSFHECCPGFDIDFVTEGTRDFTRVGNEGPALTSAYIFQIGQAHVHGRGRLLENGLSAGAYSPTGSLGQGAGRGVAYRTLVNMGASARTFRVNAIFHGRQGLNGGVGRAGIYVFDTTLFSQTLEVSPKTPGHFLLDADDAGDIRDTLSPNSISLARFFPSAALLAQDIAVADFPPDEAQSVSMQTGPVTLQPGGMVTVLFDVAAQAQFSGSANFGNTLSPAPVFISDSLGNPVYDVVAVGPAAAPAAPVASLALSPAAASTSLGTSHSITAIATSAGGAKVADATVTFQVTTGPNAGTSETLATDADGEATFSYAGTTLGTDSIAASAGAVIASAVENTWVAGAVDRIVLTPADATIDVGASQAYTVEAFDAFANSLGDVTASTTFEIAPDGSCSGASCTATTAGAHTVTATYNGKSAQAGLMVTGGGGGGFQFTGFFAPVDNLPVVNVMKAGSSVPVKFSLGGNQGLDIFAAGSPVSRVVGCDAGSVQATVDETVAASSSGLKYDAALDQYVYVWKTGKGWGGSCRQLDLTFTDGTKQSARFRFK